MRISSRWRYAAAVLGVFLSVAALPAGAEDASSATGAKVGAGNINLSPKRVTFDAAGHAQTVYVFNRGTAPETYSVALVDRVMMPDGRIVNPADEVKDTQAAALAAKLKSPKDFIVFTPRRVTLGPGESQVIRLRPMKSGDLAEGEYRTHLTITQVPPEDTGLTAEQAAGAANSKEVSVRIIPLLSISIPVILRQGAVDVRAGLQSARVEEKREPAGTTGVVALDLVRLGANSVYGNIEVRDGDDLLGAVRGVAVYTEIDRRPVQIALTHPPRHGEKLSITFIDDDTQPGKELAQVALVAP